MIYFREKVQTGTIKVVYVIAQMREKTKTNKNEGVIFRVGKRGTDTYALSLSCFGLIQFGFR